MTVLAARAAEFGGGYAWGVVRHLFEPEMGADGGRRLAGDAVALAAPALRHGAGQVTRIRFLSCMACTG